MRIRSGPPPVVRMGQDGLDGVPGPVVGVQAEAHPDVIQAGNEVLQVHRAVAGRKEDPRMDEGTRAPFDDAPVEGVYHQGTYVHMLLINLPVGDGGGWRCQGHQGHNGHDGGDSPQRPVQVAMIQRPDPIR